MSAKALHLNLLQPAERLSSSPVRVKIMLPIVSGVILAAVLLWWGSLLLQSGLTGSEVKSLRSQLAATESKYAEVCKLRDALVAKEAELNQLKGYMNARKAWGETLAAVATTLPAGIQLTALEIPEPIPPKLAPPPGIRAPVLLGPTNETEAVVFRMAGKTAREQYVFQFLDAVKKSGGFTNNLMVADHKMRQFGQDRETDETGFRAIVFDVEYPTPGRRFTP